MIITEEMINKLADWQDAGNRFFATYFPVDTNDFAGIRDFSDANLLCVGEKIDDITLIICSDNGKEWSYTIKHEYELGKDFERLVLSDMMDFVEDRFRRHNEATRGREGAA